MIETNKYTRKPFEVEAVQVTADNMTEVAQWCSGEVVSENETNFVKVEVAQALNDRQTKAFASDWVLFAKNGYKVYTDKAFKRSFDLVPGAVGAALQEAQSKPKIAVG